MVRTASVLVFSVLAALVMVWLLFGSIMILNPSSADWMAAGDLASYHLCSIYYAADGWRWPLGLNPNYGEGFEASIAQCTPSFVFSLGDKMLTTLGILSPTQQHHGFLILMNFVLQFVAAFVIFRHLLGKSYTVAALLIALLFTQVPEFLTRNTGHLDLGAHYILLFGMFAILAGRRHLHLWFASLMLLGILTHTYLFAMVFGLYCLGVALELARVRPSMDRARWLRKIVGSVGIVIVAVAAVVTLFYALTGISSETSIADGGYGYFRSDLLTFFDGNGSIFLGDLPSDAGENEGAFYLGIGFLSILAVFGFLLIRRRGRLSVFTDCTLNWKLIALFCLITTLYAASHRLSIGSTEFVVDFGVWKELGSLFRASGRFIWLSGYILCIAVTFAVARLLPKTQLIALLVVVNTLQFAEGAARHSYYPALAWSTRYVEPMEAIARSGITGIRTMQPGFAQTNDAFLEIAYATATVGLSIDQYYLARSNARLAEQLRRERVQTLLQSDYELGFAYLVPMDDEALARILNAGSGAFTYAMGNYVVVSRSEIPGLNPYSAAAHEASQPDLVLSGSSLGLVLGDGWGGIEGDWGVWSVQDPAIVLIPQGVMPDGVGEVTLSVTPLSAIAGQPSTLRVYCPDGAEAQNEETGQYACPVEGAETSIVELRLDMLNSPEELGINSDPRRLGVALHEVELSWQ